MFRVLCSGIKPNTVSGSGFKPKSAKARASFPCCLLPSPFLLRLTPGTRPRRAAGSSLRHHALLGWAAALRVSVHPGGRPPTLFFMLLGAKLEPHACGQDALDQENGTTPGTPSASPTSLNKSHFAFSLYRQMVATNPDSTYWPSPSPSASWLSRPGQQHTTRSWRGWDSTLPGSRMTVTASILTAVSSIPSCHLRGSASWTWEACCLWTRSTWYRHLLIFPRTCTTQMPYSSPLGTTVEPGIRRSTSLGRESKIRKLGWNLSPDTVLILADYIFFKGK